MTQDTREFIWEMAENGVVRLMAPVLWTGLGAALLVLAIGSKWLDREARVFWITAAAVAIATAVGAVTQRRWFKYVAIPAALFACLFSGLLGIGALYPQFASWWAFPVFFVLGVWTIALAIAGPDARGAASGAA